MFTVGPALFSSPVAMTFASSLTGSGITLSSKSTVATRNTTSGAYNSSLSSQIQVPAKAVAAIHISSSVTVTSFIAGWSYASPAAGLVSTYLGVNSTSWGLSTDANVYNDTNPSATHITATANGNWIVIAVDLTGEYAYVGVYNGSSLAWASSNGNPVNPSTGTNPWADTFGNQIVVGASLYTTGHQATIAGTTATIPSAILANSTLSGFSPWLGV